MVCWRYCRSQVQLPGLMDQQQTPIVWECMELSHLTEKDRGRRPPLRPILRSQGR